MGSKTETEAENETRQRGASAWGAVLGVLAITVVVLADVADQLPIQWWGYPAIALVGGLITGFITLMQYSGERGLGRVILFRSMIWVFAAVWGAWTSLTGGDSAAIIAWFGSLVALIALSQACHITDTPTTLQAQQQREVKLEQTPLMLDWQTTIRQVTKWKNVIVYHHKPWADARNGMRLWVELPADEGYNEGDLQQFCPRIAAARRLPDGCVIQALPSGMQGVAILDIMLRDCLDDTSEDVHIEPTTPASINDPFSVLKTPRSEELDISLRIDTLVVGGSTGSGKTTLLHRIIMYLARCTDALIWIADLNGGGVAEPWIRPWAQGKASRPVVDWVADNEAEMAVMVAVAGEIARDRKTNRKAAKRRRGKNTTVLPVDNKMPAIMLLADEGGEIRQAASLLGQWAANGLTRLAQIGRAEAVRPMVSILRGTSDLLDKNLRVNAATRVCLRMNEATEYDHVLGVNPGRTVLRHIGAGYLKTATTTSAIYGRTVNVLLSALERHAIACADLRPELDPDGRRVAANLQMANVTGGKEYEILNDHPIMEDVVAGRAYEGRWDRYADKLAEMRGDGDDADDDDDDDVPAGPPVRTVPAVPVAKASAVSASTPMGPATDRPSDRTADHVLTSWVTQVSKVVSRPGDLVPEPVAAAPAAPAVAVAEGEGAQILMFPGSTAPAEAAPARTVSEPPRPAGGKTVRQQIMDLVSDAGPAGIRSSEIEKSIEAARSRVTDMLRILRNDGEITYRDGVEGLYVLARYERQAAE